RSWRGVNKMQSTHRWPMRAVLILVALTGVSLVGCAQSTGSSSARANPPARVVPIQDSDLSQVILTADAARRVGIATAPVRDEQLDGVQRKVVPYSALLYDVNGQPWVYTNPASLTYVRAKITIDRIIGDLVVLWDGPPDGVLVVTAGVAEL